MNAKGQSDSTAADDIRLGREMVMDAGLADPDRIRDVGITEAVVTAGDDQGARAGKDVVCGGGEVAHKA